MIVPPPNLPPESTPWAEGINDAQKSTRETLDTLEGDIATRFSALTTTMNILTNQVANLEEYIQGVGTTTIRYIRTSGFVMRNFPVTVASLTIAVPAGMNSVSLFAAAHADMTDVNNLLFQPESRIVVGMVEGPFAQALFQGPALTDRVSFASSLGADITVAGEGSITIDFQLANTTNDFPNPSGPEASLVCIASFH